MNRERKVLLAVLGVGAMALAADRLWLQTGHSGPQAASASAYTVTATDPASIDAAAAAARALLEPTSDDPAPSTGPTVAERLAQLAQAEALPPPREAPDAFMPSADWLPRDTAPPDEPAPRRHDPAEQFRQQHRLMAVMTNDGAAVAIVDDRALRVGQQVDGFTLVAVREGIAVFERGDIRLELRVHESE